MDEDFYQLEQELAQKEQEINEIREYQDDKVK